MSGSSHGLEVRKLTGPQVLALLVWFSATIVLGTFGYLRHAQEHHELLTVGSALYHTAQLFLLHAPHFDGHVNATLEIARWSAALFLGGTIYNVGQRIFGTDLANLLLHLRSGHLVVCGLGRRGLECVRLERAKPRRERRTIVVVDRSPPDDLVTACRGLGARVILGDVTDPVILQQANAGRAGEVYALCPEDGTNCEVAVQVGRLRLAANERTEASRIRRLARQIRTKLGRPAQPLKCNVHLTDVDLRAALQQRADVIGRSGAMEVRFFDLYDVEARRLLLRDLPIDHAGVLATEPRRVHLIILGMGRMGRAVAARAARVGHFANAVFDPSRRLRISFLDRNAAQREAALLFRYRRFRNCCDLDGHEMDVESEDARTLIEGWCSDPASICCLVICFDDEARAFEVALRLDPVAREHGARVGLRLARRSGLASVMALLGEPSPAEAMRPFGMLEDGCCSEAFTEGGSEILAKAIHENYVKDEKKKGTSDNPSLRSWEELSESFRESNRQQADHIDIKLRAIGCEIVSVSDPRPAIVEFDGAGAGALGKVDLLARMEHDRWNAERWMDGWSYAAGDKNAARRTNPDLVPWDDLREESRNKDRAAVSLIPALLGAKSMKACRRP